MLAGPDCWKDIEILTAVSGTPEGFTITTLDYRSLLVYTRVLTFELWGFGHNHSGPDTTS